MLTVTKTLMQTIGRINEEIATNAPILFSLLQACLKTKGPRTNMKELVAVVVSKFYKHHTGQKFACYRRYSPSFFT